MRSYNCIVLFCAKLGNRLYGSGNLAASQTTGANRNLLVGTVYNSIDLSDVCLPGSSSLSVRVGDIVAEGNALSANAAFCHIYTPPCFLQKFTNNLIYYIFPSLSRDFFTFLDFFCDFSDISCAHNQNGISFTADLCKIGG